MSSNDDDDDYYEDDVDEEGGGVGGIRHLPPLCVDWVKVLRNYLLMLPVPVETVVHPLKVRLLVLLDATAALTMVLTCLLNRKSFGFCTSSILTIQYD